MSRSIEEAWLRIQAQMQAEEQRRMNVQLEADRERARQEYVNRQKT